MRTYNTKRNGEGFSEKEIDDVWKKADWTTDDSNMNLDVCGREIHRDKYGDTSSQYGWEIDHIQPVNKGGGDDLNNLQPLQWETNRNKGDRWPVKSSDYC